MADVEVSRRHVLRGAGIAGAAGAAGLAALAPTAQAARAGSASDNAIVGAWRGTVTIPSLGLSFGTLVSFALGGTLVTSGSIDLQNTQAAQNLSTPGYGAWKGTGSNKYVVGFEFFTFDLQTNPSGRGVLNADLSVDGDKQAGTFSIAFFDLHDKVIVKDVPGTLEARRIRAG
jgi:opacity protein-like surface antigen